MSKFRWNYRSIVFLLSVLDILAILVIYPAKSQAELPKSDVSTIEVEKNKAPEAVVNQTVNTLIAPVTLKKAPNDLRDRVTPVSQLLQVAPPTNKKAPNNAAGQTTSVSQLSDIKPTDWAFQALQSLVERYGVIAGYTDGTFKGDRSLTRYEFAAGLNAALDRLNELIATSTTDLVKREDLDTIKKLQEQFSPELAQLRGRVDSLETRTAKLEATKFTTTTKLIGRVQIVASELLAGNNVVTKRPAPNNVTLQGSTSLRLNTSFNGKDSLGITIGGGNIESLGQTKVESSLLGTYEGRTADNSSITFARNTLILSGVRYRFLPFPNTQVNIYPLSDGASEIGLSGPVNPYFESSSVTGANGISRFSRRSLVYNYGDSGPGIAILQGLGKQLQFGIAYSAPNGGNPTTNNGLFTGRYLALAQLIYYSGNRNFRVAATYVNTYSPSRTLGFSGTNFGPAVGSNLVNSTVDGVATLGNLYGLQAFYQVNSKLAINAWVSYGVHRYLGRGDGEAMDWAVGLAFPDLFSEGALGGVLVGMEPKLISLSRNVDLGKGLGQADRDTSLHVEAFYQYKIGDNIEVTPGLIWITAPDSDASNPDSLFAWVRTVFRF
ncbi:iron uptake porin [Nostoc sp. 'Peltigera malacea cyanobiont' DB3992]|uniref:iron uptake porin n=1 Tax=Nostoc sp. 'Peltigera malacea cyanobiont' DB3992 TaxID=1206980 RepID=UPI000C04EA3D|nr:iron uptake porin [Nostoc sp. 'Peltigera malacea cyanobiont' DB3992]PHM10827.1 S-layer protein [Nostoc sp. 'Peltigera malacea cyanobiont' DB3992]